MDESEIAERMLDGRRPEVLVVHAGWRKARALGLACEPFAEALMARAGTLLMPAMTWRTVNAASPVFDELATPGHVGALAEVFRLKYSTQRSLHVTHSVAGAGPLCRALLSTHLFGDTPVAANSPYGLMRNYDTWILLVECGLESCTALHHPEEVMAPEVYVNAAPDDVDYRLIDRHGREHRQRMRRHVRVLRDFPKFGGPAHALEVGPGQPPLAFRLIELKALMRTVFEALVEDPRATLAA
ncbi:MAG: AAC(3) family N-acetyltransferase [Gammaproteobacteria bacterium]|nr:AAC(3) family N-acetyltransferase [Gammaproteobacteria bacterium]MBI5615223.1 AAC(3) family N-acetyltransferase [Gammaproteobacteria bacterium]